MSIRERIDELVKGNALIPFRLEGVKARRALFMTHEMQRVMSNPVSSVNFFQQKAEIISFFERWVGGGLIAIRLTQEGKDAELARLMPPPEEIWEIRLLAPRPQVRVFGRFAARDMLVVTAAHNRDQLGSATSRTGKRNQSWLRAMYDCERDWNRIFGGAEPLRGYAIGDYVSENRRRSV